MLLLLPLLLLPLLLPPLLLLPLPPLKRDAVPTPSVPRITFCTPFAYRGASFGVGAIADGVSAEAFGERLDRIVPRLFRYRFDPSAKTRSAMDQLWRSVVSGGSGGGGDFSAREKKVLCWRG